MTRTRFNHLLSRTLRHRPTETRTPRQVDAHRKQLRFSRPGKIGGALLMWIIGIPIPLILLFFLIRGCVG